jgi:hypothetical protein
MWKIIAAQIELVIASDQLGETYAIGGLARAHQCRDSVLMIQSEDRFDFGFEPAETFDAGPSGLVARVMDGSYREWLRTQ